MPVGLLKQIIDRMPKNTRLLGLDVGTKTIGMAVADPASGIATPLGTLKRTKFTKDIHYLEKIIKDYEIGGFIIGLPLNMDGTEGPRCQSVRDFANEFKKHLPGDSWIALWDERLSSHAAKDSLLGFLKPKKAKEKGIVDKLAAQNILQGAMEFIKAGGY
jgi:putative holliday junction resolvase